MALLNRSTSISESTSSAMKYPSLANCRAYEMPGQSDNAALTESLPHCREVLQPRESLRAVACESLKATILPPPSAHVGRHARSPRRACSASDRKSVV